MAYTDDSVLAKLSALNETQESIVTVSQWIMFHKYVRMMGFNVQAFEFGSCLACM